MDIDAERLKWAKKGVEKLVSAGNHPAKVEATLDRVEALTGADVVLTTILAGSTEVWRHDIEIPKKYGVDTNVGDTRGPSGIFRFLRTINPMMDIVRDMEKSAQTLSCSITPTRWPCLSRPSKSRSSSLLPAYVIPSKALP